MAVFVYFCHKCKHKNMVPLNVLVEVVIFCTVFFWSSVIFIIHPYWTWPWHGFFFCKHCWSLPRMPCIWGLPAQVILSPFFTPYTGTLVSTGDHTDSSGQSGTTVDEWNRRWKEMWRLPRGNMCLEPDIVAVMR